jgi:putative transposase
VPASVEDKRRWIEPEHRQLSIRRQCELLELPRAGYYYRPATESEENLRLMRLIDEQYTRTPFYGSRRMTAHLVNQGHRLNRKRTQRLMRLMGLEGLAPGPRTSRRHPEHTVYPYLLRDVTPASPNHVWSTDITYLPMRGGFMYLVAIMDWYSRYVLAWSLSNTLDTAFCLEALDRALSDECPAIFNSDQGVQFTSDAYTGRLEAEDIAISMDGRGRAFDNIFVERLWRTVKYEDIYLKDYGSVWELEAGLRQYFEFYNDERPHQALAYCTPSVVHHGC